MLVRGALNIRDGCRDARLVWKHAILVVCQAAIAAGAFAFAVLLNVETGQYERIREFLAEEEVVSFWPVEAWWNGPAQPDGAVDTYLRERLDGHHGAYSLSIAGNYPTSSPGGPGVVVVAGAAPQLPDDGTEGLCIYVGAFVGNPPTGGVLDLGPHRAPVCGRLDAGTALFSAMGIGISLDRALVLVGSYGEIMDSASESSSLDGVRTDLMMRLVLTGAGPDDAVEYAQLVRDADIGLTMSPIFGANGASGEIESSAGATLLAGVAAAALGVLSLGSIGVVVRRVLRERRRELVVSRLVGARHVDIGIRVGTLLVLLGVLPISASVGLALWAFTTSPQSRYVVAQNDLASVVAITAGAMVIASIVVALRSGRTEIAEILRTERA